MNQISVIQQITDPDLPVEQLAPSGESFEELCLLLVNDVDHGGRVLLHLKHCYIKLLGT